MRSSTKCKDRMGPVTRENGDVITDDVECVEVLTTYFSSVYTKENTDNLPVPRRVYNGPEDMGLDDSSLSPTAVLKRLRAYQIETGDLQAAGADQINPTTYILKEAATALAKPFRLLFTRSLEIYPLTTDQSV